MLAGFVGAPLVGALLGQHRIFLYKNEEIQCEHQQVY